MTEQDCNPIAPKALPISTHSLVSFDNLHILRRKVLESIFLVLPSDGPDENLFKQPIQIVVVGVNGGEVKLGIHAHPDLQLEQGPEPNGQWRQRWEDEQDRQPLTVEPDAKPPPEVAPELNPESDADAKRADPEKASILDLCDDMYDLQAAYQFFGMAMKPILQSEEHWEGSRKSQHGYAILLDWVLEHGEQLANRLEQHLEKDRQRA